MRNEEAFQRMSWSIARADKEIPELVKRIRTMRRAATTSSGYWLLASEHRVRAMQAKYVEGDDAGFRQHMHVASLLEIKSIELKDSDANFQNGIDAPLTGPAVFWYALFSDSPHVIDAMARLEPAYYSRHRDAPLNPQFIVHMWQLAILGDDETLSEKVQKLAKNGRKPWHKDCAEGVDFFSLLMRADKAALEAHITKDAKLPNDDPITGDFFTYLATFKAKLCWYRGIEVQIDSPRVPMDLMPVRPLAHYDDLYDFLQPGWVPPPQGLLAKMGRWFGRGDR